METTPLLYHLRRIKCQSEGHPNKLLTDFSAITTLHIFNPLTHSSSYTGLRTHHIHTLSKVQESCISRELSDLNIHFSNFTLFFLKTC